MQTISEPTHPTALRLALKALLSRALLAKGQVAAVYITIAKHFLHID